MTLIEDSSVNHILLNSPGPHVIRKKLRARRPLRRAKIEKEVEEFPIPAIPEAICIPEELVDAALS